MGKVFDHPIKVREAANLPLSHRQGGQSVSEFVVTFCILTAETDWDQAALQGIFLQGLDQG